MRFDDIKPGARLRGLDATGVAEIVQVSSFGSDAINVVFRIGGRVGERLVFRRDENGFEFLHAGRTYGFDADGGLLADDPGVGKTIMAGLLIKVDDQR